MTRALWPSITPSHIINCIWIWENLTLCSKPHPHGGGELKIWKPRGPRGWGIYNFENPGDPGVGGLRLSWGLENPISNLLGALASNLDCYFPCVRPDFMMVTLRPKEFLCVSTSHQTNDILTTSLNQIFMALKIPFRELKWIWFAVKIWRAKSNAGQSKSFDPS